MLFQFYIELQDSDPLVWRRIIVPADYTLYKLHMAIQGSFGWENSHLFQFSLTRFDDKICYGIAGYDEDDSQITIDAEKTKMQKIFKKPGQAYLYIYDFGDSWEHKIVLEQILDKEFECPWCLEGEGACPPEDVGGLGGYETMVEALNTPGQTEKASYIEWLGLKKGEKWKAGFCSVREVNKRLVLLK